jgi:hypothetical protein
MNAPNIQPQRFDQPDNVLAIMVFKCYGAVLDSQADVDRVAIEVLPLHTGDYVRYTELIRSGQAHAVPLWHADGETLQLALVRNDNRSE